jgi:hypothetical protein
MYVFQRFRKKCSCHFQGECALGVSRELYIDHTIDSGSGCEDFIGGRENTSADLEISIFDCFRLYTSSSIVQFLSLK